MFEKLKEYSLYIILGLIALGTLAYAYISVTNTQRGALIDENNSKAIMNTLMKTDQQKQGLTIANELLNLNGGKNIGSYKIDNSKVSYVIGETYDDIFENGKLMNISANFENLESGQIRTILIANPAITIEGSEDVKLVELNKDNTLEYGENVITREELRELSNTLKGYNISAIGYGPFSNLQEAKDFRNSYFSTYEIFQIGDSGQYIVLKEYKVSNSENNKTKLSSNENNNTGGNNNEGDDDDEEENICNQECNDYLCLDCNGVTIKAKTETICGNEYEFKGNMYYVACNKNDVQSKIFDEGYQANRIVTTKVTDMSYLFGDSAFNEDISNWDTSNVTDMSQMFFEAYMFNQDLKYWNTSKVTNMREMFNMAYEFDGDISTWNTSKVTNMYSMFCQCENFNQNIGNWDTSNVTDMHTMFSMASLFNQPIGNWNTSKVTNMEYMFESAYEFNQPIGNWNTSNVTNMNNMFNNASNFNQDIGKWNISKVSDLSDMFTSTQFNNGGSDSIKNWNTGNVTNMSGIFSYVENFNQPIGNWDTSKVTNMNLMFSQAESFNQSLDGWDVSNVTNMRGVFRGATKFNNGGSDGIKNWNTSNVVQMNHMFESAKVFNQDISNWNTQNVENMDNMFSGAKVFNQDISGWNVHKLITHKYFDSGSNVNWTSNKKPHLSCTNDTDERTLNYSNCEPALYVDTNGVTIKAKPFARPGRAYKLNGKTYYVAKNTIGLFPYARDNLLNSKRDTENLFSGEIGCLDLRLQLSGGKYNADSIVTTKCTNMQNLFFDTWFNQPIQNWDVSNVTNMNNMFNENSSFNQNISNWNVTKVTNHQNFDKNTTNWNSNYKPVFN